VLVRRIPGQEPTPELGAGGVVTAAGQPLGVLRGLRFEPAGDLAPAVLKAVWRVVGPLVEERLAALLDGPDGAFSVDSSGLVAWDEAPVAQLVPGAEAQRPRVRLLRLEGLDGTQRGRLQARLDAWVTAWAAAPWRGLDPLDADDVAARGLAFALRRAGGSLDRADVAEPLARLSQDGRAALRAAGVRLGARTLWWPRALAAARELAIARRVAGLPTPTLRDDGGAEPFPAVAPGGEALGFRRVEGRWVRVDVLERWIAGGPAALRAAGVRDVEAWLPPAARPPRSPPPRGRRREELP
jgi:ATP-dependent RNA helicase SUPV3L1/SUV3